MSTEVIIGLLVVVALVGVYFYNRLEKEEDLADVPPSAPAPKPVLKTDNAILDEPASKPAKAPAKRAPKAAAKAPAKAPAKKPATKKAPAKPTGKKKLTVAK